MRTSQHGLTLPELLVTVTVAAILVGIALPSVSTVIAKRRLDGAANELSADLQYARTQAVSDNTAVTLATTGTTGYSITGNQTYKTISLPAELSVTSGQSISFEPLRGCIQATCTGNSVSITMSSTKTPSTLRAVVNAMGRVQLCSPSGSFGGYPSC